jgi:hypothetical protein
MRQFHGENTLPKEKTLRIRNSTAEFLIFSRQAGENSIEVRVEDETVWLTQKPVASVDLKLKLAAVS